jgi:hypothetical protein
MMKSIKPHFFSSISCFDDALSQVTLGRDSSGPNLFLLFIIRVINNVVLNVSLRHTTFLILKLLFFIFLVS